MLLEVRAIASQKDAALSALVGPKVDSPWIIIGE
jgi:hypothetical protein